MNLEYLNKRQEELFNLISNKRRELLEVNISLKENYRFSEILEKESSTPFTEFTPQVISPLEKKKQQDLYAQGNKLLLEKEALEIDIENFENELNSINDLLKTIKTSLSDIKDNQNNLIKKVLSKVIRIQEIILQDPMRASLELKSLEEYLNNLI